MKRRVWQPVVKLLEVPKEKWQPGLHRFALQLACGHIVGRHLLRPKGLGPDRAPCFRCTKAAS